MMMATPTRTTRTTVLLLFLLITVATTVATSSGTADSEIISSSSGSGSDHDYYYHRRRHKRLHDLIRMEWLVLTERQQQQHINATTTTNHNDIMSSNHSNFRTSRRLDNEDGEDDDEFGPSSFHDTIDKNMDVSFAQKIHALALDTIYDHMERKRGSSDHGHDRSWWHHHSSCPNDLQYNQGSSDSRRMVGQNYLPATMYGADPTGQNDSTYAFQRLVKDILISCDDENHGDTDVSNNNKTTCPTMASGIVDLGGATIDLEGGSYMISEPIYVPPFYGNLNIANGVLRANPDHFSPNKRWLIEIGNLTECLEAEQQNHDQQNSCHEFINLHHLLLDANHVAAGGIKVSGVMGATIDAVFVTHFPYVGIQIDEGHEIMMSNCWLAEWYWKDDHQPGSCHKQHSIGIQISGFDHYITNTIIFHCTKIGVQIRGGANVLEGVHTWNGGGTGIEILKGSSQNRLIGCYLDWNSLDLYTPIQTLTVEFGFFLQTGIRLIASNETLSDLSSSVKKNKVLIDGLILRSNSYSIWDTTTGRQQQLQKQSRQPIEVIGHFPRKSIKNVQVMNDFYSNKATKASKSLLKRNSTFWRFEFEDELLFPFIDRVVSYTVVPTSRSTTTTISDSSDDLTFFQHMLLPINGTTVQAVTSIPIDATIHIVVEQG